jgi:hypothetical protein
LQSDRGSLRKANVILKEKIVVRFPKRRSIKVTKRMTNKRMTNVRYHFLDGLRGVAMLLGLVLHGVMSFAGILIWPAEDVRSAPEFFRGDH